MEPEQTLGEFHWVLQAYRDDKTVMNAGRALLTLGRVFGLVHAGLLPQGLLPLLEVSTELQLFLANEQRACMDARYMAVAA